MLSNNRCKDQAWVELCMRGPSLFHIKCWFPFPPLLCSSGRDDEVSEEGNAACMMLGLKVSVEAYIPTSCCGKPE